MRAVLQDGGGMRLPHPGSMARVVLSNTLKKQIPMNPFKKYGLLPFMAAVLGCTDGSRPADFSSYPTFSGPWQEMTYSPRQTDFMLWAPSAQAVRLHLYDQGTGSAPLQTIDMARADSGQWKLSVPQDLAGKFYTFQIRHQDKWLDETPGVMARAVGVNGRRASILSPADASPEGWENDRCPELKQFSDIVLYEMHHRDFSMDSLSGIRHKGKFLALTESGTATPDGQKTGLAHLRELGVTHVHLLPSFDFASVDESRPDSAQYNWGYDPLNYNVPEGSYATDPFTPATRIREFKQMVMALHKAGIRVVLDVVYNHTYSANGSNFNLTVPGYFYRQLPDGSLANGSGCGNETASEREMMRKFIVESVCYWAQEYHIDGFRFDLMGIHDIATMQAVRRALDRINPTIFIYGEGWAASTPAYPADSLAMKVNTLRIPGVAAFSDELRDGLRGSVTDDKAKAFIAGEAGHEAAVMFGIAAALPHPQLKDSLAGYPTPWTQQPAQMISYVSCHDDHCIGDRLRITLPDADEKTRTALYKLAQTAVMTSQGVPFIFAGDEVMRHKKGVKNSFCSPDSINTIDWRNKALHRDAFDYTAALIAMRKAHPAFRLGSAEKVYQYLEFLPAKQELVVAFRIKGQPEGESWKNITVLLNAGKAPASISVPQGNYRVVCRDGRIDCKKGLGQLSGSKLTVAPQSALIVHQ